MKIYVGDDSVLISYYVTEPLYTGQVGIEVTEAELAWIRGTLDEYDCVQEFLQKRE